MTVTIDTKAPTFETAGIERIVEDDRAHIQLRDTLWLWWSANAVVATVALGALSVFFGLGFVGSLIVIAAFTIAGTLPVAFLSTLGPRTGLAQMALTRFSFGLNGARLPALFNALACIGWSAVNVLIGASLLVSWSAGAIPNGVALLVLAVVTTAVSVFGYFIVHRYERFAWVPMFLLFGYVFVTAAPHFNPTVQATVTGLALFSSVATFGGAIFGYAIGWSSYASDYTRRQPANSPRWRVFVYALLGVAVPCIALETLGALLGTTLGPDAGLPATGQLISANIGGGAVASIVVLLLAFSTIANNVPNDYSFALSTQVVGLRWVPRWMLTLVGAAAYIAVAFAIQNNFNLNLEGFLLLIAYWLGSYNAILLIEHVLRRGRYPVVQYANRAALPRSGAAVVSMIVGLAVAALGVNQASVINYEGPLAHLLGDADIGFPLAIVVTAVLYYVLRKRALAKHGK